MTASHDSRKPGSSGAWIFSFFGRNSIPLGEIERLAVKLGARSVFNYFPKTTISVSWRYQPVV